MTISAAVTRVLMISSPASRKGSVLLFIRTNFYISNFHSARLDYLLATLTSTHQLPATRRRLGQRSRSRLARRQGT